MIKILHFLEYHGKQLAFNLLKLGFKNRLVEAALQRRASNSTYSSPEENTATIEVESLVKTVLVLGGNGFLGAAVIKHLQQDGHHVIAGVRSGKAQFTAAAAVVEIDFRQGMQPEYWLPFLQDVDVVVNAIGIIHESVDQRFEVMHHLAPAALFQACSAARVKTVIHFSALGADQDAETAYHLSKKAGDDALRSLDIPAFILQPSLIFGAKGSSTRLFTLLSSLPVHFLPGAGKQQVQPIHVDDVSSLVSKLVATLAVQQAHGVITLLVAGPEAMSLRRYLGLLRLQMGLGKALVISLPMSLAYLLSRLARLLPGHTNLFSRDNLSMLERGSTGDIKAMQSLLGYSPRPVEEFIPPSQAEALRQQAMLDWGLPLLRLSLALVWIVTGLLSLGIYPVAQSYELLGEVGLHGDLATLALYGAASLDVALGLGILFIRQRQWLWGLQLWLILGYTALISWYIPEFWLHPFGPLLKNLPMLALIYFLMQMEKSKHGD